MGKSFYSGKFILLVFIIFFLLFILASSVFNLPILVIENNENNPWSIKYVELNNYEKLKDEIDMNLPGFIDIKSFSKYVNNDEIVLRISMRKLDDKFLVNQSNIDMRLLEYCWGIRFDLDNNEKIEGDISILLESYWEDEVEEFVDLNSDEFRIVIEQNNGSFEKQIGIGTFERKGDTLILKVDKTQNNILKNIGSNVKVHAYTIYNDGIKDYRDITY
jgi:hypothetical protein